LRQGLNKEIQKLANQASEKLTGHFVVDQKKLKSPSKENKKIQPAFFDSKIN
jgi:hypothetical protein